MVEYLQGLSLRYMTYHVLDQVTTSTITMYILMVAILLLVIIFSYLEHDITHRCQFIVILKIF
jgi:hypothetical protein